MTTKDKHLGACADAERERADLYVHRSKRA
jgi:hypothetical protein